MYIAPDPVNCSQVLYMTNIQENKLHLIKNKFTQMWLFFKHLQSVIDPGRAFQSRGRNTKRMNPKAFEFATRNCYLAGDCGAQYSNISSLLEQHLKLHQNRYRLLTLHPHGDFIIVLFHCKSGNRGRFLEIRFQIHWYTMCIPMR